MCPDHQLLSVYMDRELPSPWKEKIEAHVKQCSACGEKLENFKRLQKLLKKDTTQTRVYVESEAHESEYGALNPETDPNNSAENILSEDKLIEEAKYKVWKKLERTERHFYAREQTRANFLRRRISIPLPAAAAAAVILVVFAIIFVSGNFSGQLPQNSENSFMFASEEEMQSAVPVADMDSVLQLLGSSGSDVIILQLPESTSFLRSGEPAIIRAADYTQGKRQR